MQIETEVQGTRYRFLKRLASGGMAELYLGEAVAPGGVQRRVALKRILPKHAHDREFTEMFLVEARLASTLQHPNIVQTYDVLKSRGDYVIVMELLDGADLKTFRGAIEQSGRKMRIAEALYITQRVCAALHYAHECKGPGGKSRNIVHRDVSPHNVFITYAGGVKLLDFGIAKVQSKLEGETETGVLKGKVLYMSPEQCSGGPLDRRSDLFATGVLLYRLLTGKFPHQGRDVFETMRAIRETQPDGPRFHRPEMSEDLNRIVMKAIAKDPDQRFQTMREMQQALATLAREEGLLVSDAELAGVVEEVLGPRERFPDVSTMVRSRDPDLPPEIVVGGEDEDSRSNRLANKVAIATESVNLERANGVWVLKLAGAIDERLDIDPIVEHLEGEVVMDSSGVTRVTSFGTRALLTLFQAARPKITHLFHVNASVAFVQQIGMVQSLLGGGKVLSFDLPYLDPRTGTEFTVRVEGEEAAKILERQEAPPAPCPESPSRMAEFDEDEDTYLNFGSAFMAETPDHVAHALKSIDEGGAARLVEITVQGRNTTLHIRRPLIPGYRWKRLVGGLEGDVTIALDELPLWKPKGASALQRALGNVADSFGSIRFTAVPLEVREIMRTDPVLAELWVPGTVRLQTLCRDCKTPRQVDVAEAALQKIRRAGVIGDLCPKCSGQLLPADPIPDDGTDPVPPSEPAGLPAEPPAPSGGMTGGLVLLAGFLLLGFALAAAAFALLGLVLIVAFS